MAKKIVKKEESKVWKEKLSKTLPTPKGSDITKNGDKKNK